MHKKKPTGDAGNATATSAILLETMHRPHSFRQISFSFKYEFVK